MRNPRSYFAPLAVGAPDPVREIPVTPVADDPFLRPVEREDARQRAGYGAHRRRPARQPRGRDRRPTARRPRAPDWSRSGETADLGGTPLWTRVNSLESPWVLDDLVTLVTEIGDVLDVVMVPKVEGPWDIHYVDRLLAQLEARAGLHAADPRPRDPRDRAGRGQRRGDRQRLAADAGHLARPGGPRRVAADEDHARRRRPSGLPRARRPGRRCRAPVLPAGPLALHDRPHGRRLRGGRHLPVLRPVRGHQGRRAAARPSSAPPT